MRGLLGLVVAVLIAAAGSGTANAQAVPGGKIKPDAPATAANGEQAITVDGLRGTYVAPKGATVAALIIAGSGPTDRDGNSPGGLKTDAYKQLARGLAKAGIASLRFDKRGVAASSTDAAGGPVKETDLTIATTAADAAALAAWLRKQPGIRRVALVGHSEGGLVALLAAKTAKVDRLVLLAAAGRPLGEVLRAQFSRQPIPEDLNAEIDRVLGVLEKGGDPGTINASIEMLFRPSVQPFLRSVLTVDPVKLAAEVKAPMLVVGGGMDLQIGRLDLEALAGARPGIAKHWEPRLTHVLKETQDDDPRQIKAYTDPTVPVMPVVIEKVAAFVKS